MKVLSLAMAAGLMTAQGQPQAAPQPAQALQELHNYFSADDYPTQAQRRNAQGTVHFTLVIDRRGMPSRCAVDQSSDDPDLDRVTCEIMLRRARFSPARDARGRAVEGSVSSRVRWVLPEGAGPGLPFLPLRTVGRIVVTGEGISCDLTVAGQRIEPGTDGDRCSMFSGAETQELVRRLGPGAVVTMVVDIAPVESPPSAEEPAWGDLKIESTARFSVATDGRIMECRSTRRQAYRALGVMPEAPDMCGVPMLQGRPFEVAPNASAPRLGTIGLRVYLRVEGGHGRP